jgi:hypothetical protein
MLDRIFHQIGHIFVRDTFAQITDVPGTPFSATIDALIADIVATVYLNDPCRAKNKNGNCERDLSVHNDTFNNLLWTESDAHKRNAPIAHFLWNYFQMVGLEIFSSELVRAFNSAADHYPFCGAGFTPRQLINDILLEISVNYRDDYSVAEALVWELELFAPENESVAQLFSDFKDKYLGPSEKDFDYAGQMYRNSPIVMQDERREIDVDGEKILLWFTKAEDGHDSVLAKVMRNDQVQTYICTRGPRGIQKASVRCYIENDGRSLIWTSDGTLSFVANR